MQFLEPFISACHETFLSHNKNLRLTIIIKVKISTYFREKSNEISTAASCPDFLENWLVFHGYPGKRQRSNLKTL
jgi:hypothetical protein